MKKTLFLLATAAIALASCSSDDTIAENMSLGATNEISFRSFVQGATRAADITTVNLDAFKAYAIKNGGSDVYFNEDVFTKQTDNTYTSTNKHYWPAEGALDFFAYAPTTSTQYTHTTPQSLTFVVTPSTTTVSEQVDLIVANTDNKTKSGAYTPVGGSESTYGAAGIPLNFRHTESKIVVKFKNGQANLKMDVLAFKIVNVDGSATYTYNATNTDTQDAALLPIGNWSGNGDAYSTIYTITPTSTNSMPANQATALYLQDDGTPSEDVNAAEEMILIPQTTNAVSVYTGTTAESTLETGKTYIAVKMIIRNNDDLWDGTGEADSNTNGTIIANCTGDGDWAIWPVAFTWIPGKKYTYTVDLGDGGYWEKEHVAGDTALDPVLDGAEIKFVDVTVDNWSDFDYDGSTDGVQPIPVPEP